jgi:hypothetical protein
MGVDAFSDNKLRSLYSRYIQVEANMRQLGVKHICVDFDDVIADTMNDGFLPNLNELERSKGWHNTHAWEEDDFREWNAAKTTGLSDDTIVRLFTEIDYKNVGHVKDAVMTIRDLADKGWVFHVLTANPDEIQIRDWLDRNGLSEYPMTSTPDKVNFMLGRGYKMIIDDKPKTLETASLRGLHAIRFEKPWNLGMSGWGKAQNEHTAQSWYGVWMLLKSLEEDQRKRAFAAYEQVYTKKLKLGLTEGSLNKVRDMQFYSDRREMYSDEEMDEIITNANGAKQSDLRARFDLLPARALKEVAAVLHRGAEKYGEENWRGLSVEEIHNHTLGHAVAFNESEELEDLAHTACRALMALEVYLGGGTDGD